MYRRAAGAAGASRVLDRGARVALAAGRPQPARGGVENVTLVVGDGSRGLPARRTRRSTSPPQRAGRSRPLAEQLARRPARRAGRGRRAAPGGRAPHRRRGDADRARARPLRRWWADDAAADPASLRSGLRGRRVAGAVRAARAAQAWAGGGTGGGRGRVPARARRRRPEHLLHPGLRAVRRRPFRDRRRRRQPRACASSSTATSAPSRGSSRAWTRTGRCRSSTRCADRRGRQPPGALHARRPRTWRTGDGA